MFKCERIPSNHKFRHCDHRSIDISVTFCWQNNYLSVTRHCGGGILSDIIVMFQKNVRVIIPQWTLEMSSLLFLLLELVVWKTNSKITVNFGAKSVVQIACGSLPFILLFHLVVWSLLVLGFVFLAENVCPHGSSFSSQWHICVSYLNNITPRQLFTTPIHFHFFVSGIYLSSISEMPSGNGAKAAQKRERNQAKQSKQTSAKSQLKSNEKALTIKCSVCMVSFVLYLGKNFSANILGYI